MNKRIEKELRRVAEATGEVYKEVKAEFDLFIKDGVSPLTAVGRVKKARRMALNRINGTYLLYPLNVGSPRRSEYNDEVHHYVDVFGIFHGPVERGGKDQPFLMTLPLKDDEGDKADVLTTGMPFKFKGSIDPRYNRIYLSRTGEFQEEDEGDIDKDLSFSNLSQIVIDELPELADLYKVDDQGEFVFDSETVAVKAEVMEINEYDGGYTVVVHDIGADPVTLWPPRDMAPEDVPEETQVLVYGKVRYKNELQISAYVIVPIDSHDEE